MEQFMSKGDIINLCGGSKKYENLNQFQVKEIVSGRVNGLRKDEIERYSNPNLSYLKYPLTSALFPLLHIMYNRFLLLTFPTSQSFLQFLL